MRSSANKYKNKQISYIGQTKRHLSTRIEEHLGKDKKSHIYSHLQENPQCQEKVNFHCFEVIIVLLLILGYKSRKQCILIGKSPNSTSTLST